MRRWLRGIAATLALASGASEAATITLQFGDGPGEGFNDPAPFTAVGGNNANSLGQARRNVFQRAAEIWGARLQSNVAIVVRASFDPLACDDTSALLGQAGPVSYFADFPGAPRPGVFYPAALADALANQNFQNFSPDIEAQFNSRIDSDPGCLGNRNFYYGFDHASSGFADDLVNTVLHELAHGLGFVSLVDDSSGASLVAPAFGIYDVFVFDEQRNQAWPQLSDAQRAASIVNTGRLVWNGAGTTAASGALTAGVNASGRVRLYAPNPVEPGSSVSHWDVDATPDLLMEPFSTESLRGTAGVDLTTCLLADLGWSLAAGVACPDRLNHAPLANAQNVSITEDSTRAIVLSGSDRDNDPLRFSVVANPAKGRLSGTAPNLSYTPDANATGADSFTFRVNDGLADSAEATVSISITAVNDAPTATAQTVTVNDNTPKAVTLAGNDVDGNPLSFTVASNPARGTLSGTAPNLTYTPALNFTGADSFTFRVSDGTATSAPATVSINVVNVNDAPVARAQTVSTNEDTTRAITLSGSDSEGSPLRFSIVTPPRTGALTGTPPNVSYVPAADNNGTDSFTFRVNDGNSNSAPATVTINIVAVNDVPVATPQTLSTSGAALNITLGGSDVDNDALSFSIAGAPANGTLTGSGTTRLYTPRAGFSGTDRFSFRANDGSASSAPATVTINVAGSGGGGGGGGGGGAMGGLGALALLLALRWRQARGH